MQNAPPCIVGLGQQRAVAVEVVGGVAAVALRDGLGNPATKGVVAVASLPTGAAFAFGTVLGCVGAGLPTCWAVISLGYWVSCLSAL